MGRQGGQMSTDHIERSLFHILMITVKIKKNVEICKQKSIEPEIGSFS